jgi:hypothetical protein
MVAVSFAQGYIAAAPGIRSGDIDAERDTRITAKVTVRRSGS